MSDKTYLNGLVYVKDRASKKTVICFSGPVSGERYQFFRSFDSEDVNVVYVKEHNAGWFQYGLPGAEGIEGLKDYLLNILNQLGTKEVYCFGSSMGSYAAILYGSIFKAVRILTFGARTYIQPLFLTNSKILKEKKSSQEFRKLQPFIRSYCKEGGKLINYCGSDEWLDIFHLSGVYDINGVECFTVPNAGHNVGAWLKLNGCLDSVLTEGLLRGNTEITKSVDSFLFNDADAVLLVRNYIKLSKSRDYGEALDLLKLKVSKYPLWIELIQKMLVLSLKVMDLDLAGLLTEKLISLDRYMLKGQYWRAKFYMFQEEWEEAYDLFKAVLDSKPGLASPLEVRTLYRGMAFCLNKLNKLDKAKECLVEADRGLPKQGKIEDLTINRALGFTVY